MAVGGTKFLVTLAEAALFLAALVPITSADTYIVGDSTGWNTPTNGTPSPYATWAAQHTFRVGDSIGSAGPRHSFNFNSGSHTIAEVSADSYNNCNSGNTINLQTFSPATFTLTWPGTKYYVCTVHCSQGMKFSINVVSTGNNTFPTPPGVFFYPPPPPSHFSNAPTNIASFVISFLSIAFTCFLY